MKLHSWIRRRPIPIALMCGDQRILIGDGRSRWLDAIEAAMATDAPQIVAVDAKGSVLRVCQRAEVDDYSAEEPDETADDVTATQKELAQLASIIGDAYSTAHEHARENSARGYELLAKFAELSFARLAQIEKAYGQLLAAHARAIDAAPTNDGLDAAISGLVSQAVGAGQNGKKEPTP